MGSNLSVKNIIATNWRLHERKTRMGKYRLDCRCWEQSRQEMTVVWWMSWHSRWKDRIDRIRIRTVNGSLLECEGKECYKLNLGPCGKTNLLTPGCGGEKYSVYWRKPSKKNRKLMLKRPELPCGFLERIFIGSLWTSLVSGKVTGWCCRNLNIQPSGSDWSGLYVVVVSM